jgi:DNA-binding transcriptional LysR family regulator
MTSFPDTDDLLLVLAVAGTGSVGAAARQLRVAQPSASQRLARLERRAGVRLFDRDTQGARPTAAGAELARQAEHILGHLGGAFEAARAAAHSRWPRVGTIASLAELVLPVVDAELDGIDQVVDHGDRLVAWLDEGTLDAAVVAIADQTELPRSLRAHRVGGDELVVVLPKGVRLSRTASQPFRGCEVVFASYDAGAARVRQSLSAAGADPRRAATIPSALATARRRKCPAVVPLSATRAPSWRVAGDRVRPLPWRYRLRLDLVLPRKPLARLLGCAAVLRRELGLDLSSGPPQGRLAE